MNADEPDGEAREDDVERDREGELEPGEQDGIDVHQSFLTHSRKIERSRRESMIADHESSAPAWRSGAMRFGIVTYVVLGGGPIASLQWGRGCGFASGIGT